MAQTKPMQVTKNLMTKRILFGGAMRMRRHKMSERQEGRRQYPSTHTDWKNELVEEEKHGQVNTSMDNEPRHSDFKNETTKIREYLMTVIKRPSH